MKRTPVFIPISLILFLFTFHHFTLVAQPTKLIVRAKAKDAKFIGTSVGGALILVKDSDTGELLAKGLTEGSTGNTGLIMREQHERYTQLSDDRTAKFETLLDLESPTLVTIEAHVPYTKKQARILASTQIWMIPGRNIEGDGIILEIPGFIIDILAPRTHQFIDAKSLNDNQLKITANVVMMCGCTISNGGLWDGAKMEVGAIIKKDNKEIKRLDLLITETPNLFEANIVLEATGNYELTVYAFDKKTNNSGVDKINFIIE